VLHYLGGDGRYIGLLTILASVFQQRTVSSKYPLTGPLVSLANGSSKFV